MRRQRITCQHVALLIDRWVYAILLYATCQPAPRHCFSVPPIQVGDWSVFSESHCSCTFALEEGAGAAASVYQS